jgi:hypothetical protein
LYETLLERQPQDLKHMARELRELIEEEDAMMRQRHFARHGDLATTEQSGIGNGVMRGAKGPAGDEGGAYASEPGDVIDARGAAAASVASLYTL